MSEYTLSERVKKAVQAMKDSVEETLSEVVSPDEKVHVKMNDGKIRIVKRSDAKIYEQRGIGKIM